MSVEKKLIYCLRRALLKGFQHSKKANTRSNTKSLWARYLVLMQSSSMHSLWQTERKTTEWHVSPAGKVKQGEIGSALQYKTVRPQRGSECTDVTQTHSHSYRIDNAAGTQAVQRTGNVYTWTRMRSHLWEWSSRFSPLHFCTTLR